MYQEATLQIGAEDGTKHRKRRSYEFSLIVLELAGVDDMEKPALRYLMHLNLMD